MKTIKLKETNDTVEYLIKEYDSLPSQTVVYAKNQNHSKIDFRTSENDLLVSYLYKDILSMEDTWKYIIMAACSIVGLLDRNRIKAMIKWPNDIYVNHQKIASIFVQPLQDKQLNGIILTIGLNVNQSHCHICMKDITKKKYQPSILLTGLTTFLNIYDNLYHTHQFHKALEYANDISYLKNKKVNYLDYGFITFEKLRIDGMIVFTDEKGRVHQKHILDIKGIE